MKPIMLDKVVEAYKGVKKLGPEVLAKLNNALKEKGYFMLRPNERIFVKTDVLYDDDMQITINKDRYREAGVRIITDFKDKTEDGYLVVAFEGSGRFLIAINKNYPLGYVK